MDTEIKKLVGTDINKYTITRYIGSGSFGNVFEGRNRRTGEPVALKIPVKTTERDGQKSLLDEAKIYKQISNPEQGVANMKVTTWESKKIIVMDLLGPSLEYLLSKHKKLGEKSVIALAIKMIDTIRYVHTRGYIHRDIKPDNFVTGVDDLRKLYCIDFGLAKKYLKRNGEHVEYTKGKKFCGTARYASIAAHTHCEQGRKDDLEAIGYLLVYLYKGKLPWQGIKDPDKNKRYELIGNMKQSLTEEEICAGMPNEFCVFLKYVRAMDFDENPQYSAFRKMFLRLYESKGYKTEKMIWE